MRRAALLYLKRVFQLETLAQVWVALPGAIGRSGGIAASGIKVAAQRAIRAVEWKRRICTTARIKRTTGAIERSERRRRAIGGRVAIRTQRCIKRTGSAAIQRWQWTRTAVETRCAVGRQRTRGTVES